LDEDMTHVSNNSGNNEWYTPDKYLDSAKVVMGGIDTDPASNDIAQLRVCASTYFTKESNGLGEIWTGRVWMNPPYSSGLIGEFCSRLVRMKTTDNVSEFITLTNNATDTKWFQSLSSVANAMCFPTGRIRFVSPDGLLGKTPLQGQCFTYCGPNVEKFTNEFSKYGPVLKTQSGN
jgi:hypothetical protein